LTLTQNDKIILKTYANKHNNFNIITKNIINKTDNFLYNSEFKKLWHNRLGHYHNNKLDKYLNEHNINSTECIECKISELNRKPHNGITPEATKINEIIYSDIMGPINESINKSRYLITFIDDFSRKAWIYPLESKTEASNTIINFIKFINNQYPENKIKTFKSDNAKEYNNKKIKNFCKRNGINKIFSPPYNPQNNGIAERFNRTITSCIKKMLHWAGLSLNFWDYAAKHATYLYNILPHKSIQHKIPNEIYYNKKVELKYLKTFGCIAHYKNFNQNKQKFDINTKKGVYLGFDINTHCYIIMDYYDQSIHLTREAVFLEEIPGNLKLGPGVDSGNIRYSKTIIDNGTVVSDNDLKSKGHEFDSRNLPSSSISDDYTEHQEFDSGSSLNLPDSQLFNNNKISSSNNINYTSPNPIDTSFNLLNNKILHSTSEDTNSSKYIISNSYNNDSCTNSKTLPENNIMNIVDDIENVSYKHVELIQNEEGLYVPKIHIVNSEVPICFNHIKYREDRKQWLSAVQAELKNLYNHHIMTFVKTIPKNANLIFTQWVFAIKRNKANEIVKYKARIVARGDLQIYGVDYVIVYSPTLDIICIRIILFFASKFKWNTFQLDIQAAYLNAPLDREVYVKIPQGDKNFGKGYWK